MKTTTFVIVAIAIFAAAPLARADCAGSERTFRTSIVTYFELPDQSANSSDPRCSIVTRPDGRTVCRIRLMGVLHEPIAIWDSSQPPPQFPAIIYNHGSGKILEVEKNTCKIANYFVPKGYAVFFPFRRGNGLADLSTRRDPNDLDPLNSSTGDNILEMKDAFKADPSSVNTRCTDLPCYTVELLKLESADVVEAFNWLKGRPFIDEGAMAIMGNSYGGIMTVLTNSLDLGHKAAVAFSPGGDSWTVTKVQAMLLEAAGRAKEPAFYLQAKWDHDTRATVELSRAHAYGGNDPLHGRRFMASIFEYPKPADLNPDPDIEELDYQSAHVGFAKSTDRWGTAVLDFLQRYGVK